MLWGDYVLEKRIAYYTKKVAEYGSIHFTKRRNPYRHERLFLYKELLNKKYMNINHLHVEFVN